VASDEMGMKTGEYMHMLRNKESSEASMDSEKGALLWSKTEELLRRHNVI